MIPVSKQRAVLPNAPVALFRKSATARVTYEKTGWFLIGALQDADINK
jgi:hypothetical protein